MNENHDAFDNYVLKFDMNERMIAYKYNHSYRVVHQAEEICRSLELDTYERDIASLIALLHDIARFRQWTDYKTFNDHESFDHGDEGVKILFDEGEIKNYQVSKEEHEVIKKAIKNHNKLKLDTTNMNEREKMHSMIIRDADKIDIIYSFSTNRLLELDEDEEEISEKIKEDFFNHLDVLKTDIKNKNDKIIMLIALVFDLNYDYSKERILNEKYLNNMYNHLKHKKIFKPYIEEAIRYLKGEK